MTVWKPGEGPEALKRRPIGEMIVVEWNTSTYIVMIESKNGKSPAKLGSAYPIGLRSQMDDPPK